MTKKEESRETYLYYKKNRVCVQCGCYSAAPNRVRCEVCLIKNSESQKNIKKRENEQEKEERKRKHREYLKKLRDERKKNGLCIMCGKPQCNSSIVYCIDCKIKNQRRNEKRKNGIDRSDRKNYGLCYRCGNTCIKGKSLCENCYNVSIQNLPKDNATNENYIRWKNQNKLIFG